jgi:predicted MFS family arabinose efflux permease
MSVSAYNLGTAVGSWVAGRALDSELGATGPAVVGAGFAVPTLVPTVVIALLQCRSPSGGRP